MLEWMINSQEIGYICDLDENVSLVLELTDYKDSRNEDENAAELYLLKSAEDSFKKGKTIYHGTVAGCFAYAEVFAETYLREFRRRG